MDPFTFPLRGKFLTIVGPTFLCNIKYNYILINIFSNLFKCPTQPTLGYLDLLGITKALLGLPWGREVWGYIVYLGVTLPYLRATYPYLGVT